MPSTFAQSQCTNEHIELLLINGAKVVLQDKDGMTPLHVAAEGDNSATLTVLLEAGGVALLDMRDKHGRNAHHLAAQMGSMSVLKVLWTLVGQDCMMVDFDGNTALHYAAKYGMEDTVKMLVAMMGSDINQLNHEGCEAMDLAVKEGHWSTASVLKEWKKLHMQSKLQTNSYRLNIFQWVYLVIVALLALNFIWNCCDSSFKSD